MTEIAPVPGTVAGAYIVSSFLMYMFMKFLLQKSNFLLCKSPKISYLREVLPKPDGIKWGLTVLWILPCVRNHTPEHI
jgi:hypothetical protein